jgi:hypothetical protein
MSPQVYRLYGLTIASELPLHQDRLVDDAEPDVVLTLGERQPVPAGEPVGIRLADVSEDDGRTRYFTFTRCADGSFVLRYYSIGDFLVSADLSQVVLHLDPGADPGFASVLATGSVPSFLLLAKGFPLLHASAVDVGGAVVAFVGYAGMGKSTMATVMCAAGATSVTDDVLRLEIGAGAARCYLGANESRLRKSASELAASFGEEVASRRTSDHREALRLPASGNELLPLSAILIPQPDRDNDVVDIRRLGKVEALLMLSRFPRIVGWEDPEALAQQFGHLSEIVAAIPVFVADVPWGPPFPRDLAAQVLHGLGLRRGSLGQGRSAGSR